VTLTDARNTLPRLAREIEREPSLVVSVVRRGRPVAALLSAELYESLVETLEILADPTALPKLRRALREIRRASTIDWESARRRLGLEE
jgi:prevent-host-death family protein